ncbi:hypothetical protein AUEXF2481DRAFT_568388 [Aureobasidium subglaciale EXF-2481]|uniref:Uncharacterized protein n=1 Tax=Aureobasidium subglaciale (strain EXF-2481) TaxID=1043005 RepID=A0A074Y3H6_AURSE|nr:uncharacterized protein AUEXF2481DRAFT_568388 [Aureobasidium subglaciale EXF-2481]KEQ90494.1 hypothetical protein AUEXF2481DRAFT_568388 [Aureobasidium subglaciale EXF-2481]
MTDPTLCRSEHGGVVVAFVRLYLKATYSAGNPIDIAIAGKDRNCGMLALICGAQTFGMVGLVFQLGTYAEQFVANGRSVTVAGDLTQSVQDNADIYQQNHDGFKYVRGLERR